MNIHEEVTHRILQQLEAGKIPWRKTWTSGLPRSLTTGEEYRGVNILVLGCTEHASRYWVTYRQALKQGGQVRKGEQATPVIYWKWRTPDEIQKLVEQTGRENIAPCVPFVSSVFNLDQVDGLSTPKDEIAHEPHRRLEVAELMMEVMPDKPKILHSLTAEPAYVPSQDHITMPHLSRFKNGDEYFATLFHELVHSTGHVRRLNRFAKGEGDKLEKYSFEELVAEFGSVFLCAFAGIKNPETEALQTSYIDGWAQVFRKDGRILMRAASAAQHAAYYIRGREIAKTAQAVAA